MKYIGAEIAGLKNRKLASGRGQYVADIKLDGMLHLAILRSPHAHARIRGIDSTAAQAVAGVVCIVTGEEIRERTKPMYQPLDPAGAGIKFVKSYALCGDRARFVGEPVAVVVAEDKYTARKAADMIDVDYEPIPPVVDCERALEAGSPLVEPEWGDNLMIAREFKAGDTERAFAAADSTVADTVSTQRYTGTPIEPRAYLATYDAGQDLVTLYASTQQPHVLKVVIAETLGLPENNVRVIQPDVGGAFGLKMPSSPEDILLPYLARKLMRPVRWIEERVESFLVGGHAREERLHYEVAFNRDGKVKGLRVKVIADLGAPTGLQGWGMAIVTATCIPTLYKIRDCHVQLFGVVTNKCSWSPYRGFGKEAASFLMDRIMDRVAAETGLDRAEVRLKNFIQPDEFPYHQVSGAMLDSGNYPKALHRLLEAIDYADFPRLKKAARRDGRRIGLGFGQELMPEGCAMPSSLISAYDGATVRVGPGGGIRVATGVTSPGTGNETALAQIVADTLGAELSQIAVSQGDTETCPFGLGNYSSRSILVGGVAARQAANDIREKLFKVAARMLEVMPPDLDAEDGRIFVKDTPGRSIGLKEVASAVYRESYGPHAIDFEPGLEATRYFRHPNIYLSPQTHPFGEFSAYPSWPSGFSACIVEVDEETGVVKVLRYCYVHDSGKIINPMLAEANMHGGFAQGFGGALYESLAYDENGQLKTATFYDYTIPTAVELPNFEVEHQETPSPFNPMGLKGVGEAGVAAPLGAICGAVEDALSDFGVRFDHTPLTPAYVWQTIENARNAPK